MALKHIAVSGCTLSHAASSPISSGVFVITAVPSLTTKCEGFEVYSGPLAFKFSGGNCTGCDPGTVVGSGSIPPTAIFSKVDGLLVIRDGDSVVMSAAGTLSGVSVSVSGGVEVSDAGQTKVKAQ